MLQLRPVTRFLGMPTISATFTSTARRKMFWALLFVAGLSMQAPAFAQSPCSGKTIDKVWSGVMVGFGAISTKDAVFVGYYNENRAMTVAKIDLRTCAIERKVLGSQFGGWDGHNYITMTLDGQNRLHVTGNMHALPLVYYAGKTALSVNDLAPERMTGAQESSVTYPAFIRLPSGELGFLYREGSAGNGSWYANSFNGRNWRKATAAPIFAGRWRDQSGREREVSAYPSPFALGGGYYSVAIVWRSTLDVSSNFRLSFARTRDLSTWLSADGRQVRIPLDPADAGVVDDTGPNKGLVNNEKLAISPNGTPVITYTKYDGGKNAIFAAHLAGGRWQIIKIADSNRLTPVSGGGSHVLPDCGPVEFEHGAATIKVAFPGEPARRIALNPTTFAPLGNSPVEHAAAPAPRENVPSVPGLVQEQFGAVRTTKETPDGANVVFRWHAQAVNGDRPRACAPSTPTACNPTPSPLVMFVE